VAQLMRHNGAMDVSLFVDRLGRECTALARIDSEDADAAARLESAIRLTLFDALKAAADEINRGLAPGSVELRLGEREADFVVTPPSPRHPSDAAGSGALHLGSRGRRRLTAWVR
jgi:hypothetical protein